MLRVNGTSPTAIGAAIPMRPVGSVVWGKNTSVEAQCCGQGADNVKPTMLLSVDVDVHELRPPPTPDKPPVALVAPQLVLVGILFRFQVVAVGGEPRPPPTADEFTSDRTISLDPRVHSIVAFPAWCEEGLRTGWEDLRLGGAPLALQPGGTDGSPLRGGACHGQMETVSGPPRRHDRGGATQLFLRRGSGDTPLLEMPRGVGVHRLTPQPGHGRRPLSDGAHHGRMGTVSGPVAGHLTQSIAYWVSVPALLQSLF